MSNARTLAGLIDGSNIVVPSGYGLDFSANANASGMTSEVLDDYEEGTWTPTYTTEDGTNEPSYTPDILENHYTKIGRMVHVICLIRTDAVSSVGSGNLAVGGLPFMTSERSFLTIDNSSGWLGSQRPEYGFIETGQTKIILTYASAIDKTTTRISTSILGNISNANTTSFSFSYLTNS